MRGLVRKLRPTVTRDTQPSERRPDGGVVLDEVKSPANEVQTELVDEIRASIERLESTISELDADASKGVDVRTDASDGA